MIPPFIFYILVAFLIGFGSWRIVWWRRKGTARYHLIWGVLWVVAGVVLLLMQLQIIPPPRLN